MAEGSVRHLDLSSDVGERPHEQGLAEDRRLLAIITSANVACGGHAGNASTMSQLCTWAAEHGVRVGAQVSYFDVEGFGRRPLHIPHDVLTEQIRQQWEALGEAAEAAGTEVAYVRPHGALYNAALVDPEIAQAVVTAVPSGTPVLVVAGTTLHEVARSSGNRVVAEVFADRAITDNGLLVPRSQPGAVISDPRAIAERLLRWVRTGHLTSITGAEVAVQAESICVHSDTPGALAAASSLRRSLEGAGVAIRPFDPQQHLNGMSRES